MKTLRSFFFELCCGYAADRYKQNHRHTDAQTDADDRYTQATPVDVSDYGDNEEASFVGYSYTLDDESSLTANSTEW